MLIEFKIQNSASYNSSQTLSMTASSSTKENFNNKNTIQFNKFGINNILKSAAIFGANASGKSNLIAGVSIVAQIVLGSLNKNADDDTFIAAPFIIKDDIYDIPTEFEIVFIVDGNIYRYGLSMQKNEILQEWLFRTKTARETMLFKREKSTIEINRTSFKEANDFIHKKEKDGTYQIEKTRKDVPFISVLSQFDGKISQIIVNWFKNIRIISGTKESVFQGYTTNLFDTDNKFKTWAMKVLSSLQIQDILITEVERDTPVDSSQQTDELGVAISQVKSILAKRNQKKKKIEIIKSTSSGKSKIYMPLNFESEGTIRLIYLLGPLYDAIQNGRLLLIDEFDNRFHSLLSKYIIALYHRENNTDSQMILTCHDTNLLTKELLRRDQIWFVEKNDKHESELYSLLEYKEHYTRKNNSYSKDYLQGKYGAIPLFQNLENLESALDE